jgi:hypothetical protein
MKKSMRTVVSHNCNPFPIYRSFVLKNHVQYLTFLLFKTKSNSVFKMGSQVYIEFFFVHFNPFIYKDITLRDHFKIISCAVKRFLFAVACFYFTVACFYFVVTYF